MIPLLVIVTKLAPECLLVMRLIFNRISVVVLKGMGIMITCRVKVFAVSAGVVTVLI